MWSRFWEWYKDLDPKTRGVVGVLVVIGFVYVGYQLRVWRALYGLLRQIAGG